MKKENLYPVELDPNYGDVNWKAIERAWLDSFNKDDYSSLVNYLFNEHWIKFKIYLFKELDIPLEEQSLISFIERKDANGTKGTYLLRDKKILGEIKQHFDVNKGAQVFTYLPF